MKKTLPLRKDSITVVRDVGCLPGKPKHKLVHFVEVSAHIGVLRQLDLSKEIKPDALRTYCTDPEIRPAIKAFDIDYRYYTIDGTFAGSFIMRESECR